MVFAVDGSRNVGSARVQPRCYCASVLMTRRTLSSG